MAEIISLDLPLPRPDADLRVGELDLADADTSNWFVQAIVDLGKLPPDRMPAGGEIASHSPFTRIRPRTWGGSGGFWPTWWV
jgi:hypothetical protein